MAPRIGGVRLVHEGWARYLVAEVMQEDGTRITREIEDHGRAVAVLPYDPDRRVATLVSQFRAPCSIPTARRATWRCRPAFSTRVRPKTRPARGDGRDGACAWRARFRLQRWSMPASPPNGWICSWRPIARRTGPGRAAAWRRRARRWPCTRSRCRNSRLWAARGPLTDMKSLALLFALQLRRPDLFAEAG